MPRVPTYDGPQVAPKAAPFVPQSSAGATPDAFGAAGGRAMEEAGRDIMRGANSFGNVLIDRAEEDNKREATKLENQFTEQLRKIGYGDGTTENPGFYGLNGENAISANPSAREQVAKARDELMAQASNQKVRDIFGLRSEARTVQENEQFDRHLLRERTKANDETGQARVKEAHADAVANRNNGDILNRSLDIAESEAVAAGKRNGWSPEVVRAKVMEGQSLILKDVILSTAIEDPQRALALYTLHKNKIAGGLHDDIERAVKGGVTLRFAQELADQTIAGGGTHKDMIDRIRKSGAAAEVRDKAIADVSRYMGVVHAETAEQRAQAAEQRAKNSEARVLEHEADIKVGGAFADKMIAQGGTHAEMQDRVRNSDLSQRAKDKAYEEISKFHSVEHAARAETRAVSAEVRAQNAEQRIFKKEEVERIAAAKARDFQDRRLAAAQMNEFLRGIDDPEVVKETEKLLSTYFMNQERAKSIEKRDAHTAAHQWVDDGKSVTQLPATIRSHLDGTTLAALERIEARRTLGTPWATDFQYYTSTLYMSPDQLRDANLIEARTKLADSEFNEFKGRVIAAHQGRFDEKLPGSIQSLYNAHVTQLFGEHAKYKNNKETVQAVSDGYQRVRAEIHKMEQKNGGRKLTEEEVQGVISRVIDPFAFKKAGESWTFSSSKQREVLDKIRVPAADAAAITRAFEKVHGRTPTTREIAGIYAIPNFDPTKFNTSK